VDCRSCAISYKKISTFKIPQIQGLPGTASWVFSGGKKKLLPVRACSAVSCYRAILESWFRVKIFHTKHDESRCENSLNKRFWCAPARFIRGLPIWQDLLQISYAVTGLSTATPGCCITADESIPRSFGSYRASA
jgi:hypothetical protein